MPVLSGLSSISTTLSCRWMLIFLTALMMFPSSSLPSKQELMGKVVGLLYTLVSQPVAIAQATAQRFARATQYVERFYRDAKIMEIIEGTTQVHEELLGKMFVGRARRVEREHLVVLGDDERIDLQHGRVIVAERAIGAHDGLDRARHLLDVETKLEGEFARLEGLERKVSEFKTSGPAPIDLVPTHQRLDRLEKPRARPKPISACRITFWSSS